MYVVFLWSNFSVLQLHIQNSIVVQTICFTRLNKHVILSTRAVNSWYFLFLTRFLLFTRCRRKKTWEKYGLSHDGKILREARKPEIERKARKQERDENWGKKKRDNKMKKGQNTKPGRLHFQMIWGRGGRNTRWKWNEESELKWRFVHEGYAIWLILSV